MKSNDEQFFEVEKSFQVGEKKYQIVSLKAAEKLGLKNISKLPFTLKILMENMLRHQDGVSVKKVDIQALDEWVETQHSTKEVAFRPARVLMQDFTGVPAIVDLVAMRDAMRDLNGDETKINPLSQVDLVIDHSVSVDSFGTDKSFGINVDIEFQRNKERYALLRWAQQSFKNLHVVPPGTGICHQVNLEFIGQTVWTQEKEGKLWAFPDTLVGTDSHTTMINSLGILGWGAGGIEAEAAMLGQPLSLLIPEVLGVKIKGSLKEGVTATDLVLTVTQMLRQLGVVGKFVEFFGQGLDHLSLPDRATISNMSPEYGATCCYFPIDDETLSYLRLTGRSKERVALVEAYAKEQGIWREEKTLEPVFTQVVELDLATIEPTIAGPTRPQDKVFLKDSAKSFKHAMHTAFLNEAKDNPSGAIDIHKKVKIEELAYEIGHGSVVIGAITSCTNTSNPSVMVAAGLMARKARELGLTVKPWVKTSLAPGSKVVTDYLEKAGLQSDLDALGFELVGYGCTTCIGNSGPLSEPISRAVHKDNLVVCAVLSGNRNFEGRINPDVKANYLASPPLVIAYSLAGSMHIDFENDPIGHTKNGLAVFLKDIWPTDEEVQKVININLTPEMFKQRYSNVYEGDEHWKALAPPEVGTQYHWDKSSTYIQPPPYLDNILSKPRPLSDIIGAFPLAILGDSITTDHISPAGSIKKDSPAGKFLSDHGVPFADFNSYGARRGNYEVMVRGTFANIRLRNEMVPGIEGGMTKHYPSGEIIPIFDASLLYQKEKVSLVVIAGKEYGSGSSRDWAAKGPHLLGVKAVIAESFERIHRSNLIGMGIVPLQFKSGVTRQTLKLNGSETFDIIGISEKLSPHMDVVMFIHRGDCKERVVLECCINTRDEIDYYYNGGILPYVLRRLT